MSKQMFKLYNKTHDVVLTPEMQLFNNAADSTLVKCGALFSDEASAKAAASRVVSPKFKLIPVTVE